jgi:hypothetical protein
VDVDVDADVVVVVIVDAVVVPAADRTGAEGTPRSPAARGACTPGARASEVQPSSISTPAVTHSAHCTIRQPDACTHSLPSQA